MRLIITSFFILVSYAINAQTTGWTKDEITFYKKAKDLCAFLKESNYDTTKRAYVFSNYIYFPDVKSESDPNPKKHTVKERTEYFDMLFYGLIHFMDSVGLQNLDAKPVRYFKNDAAFYKPFNEDLKWADSVSLAYFDKRKPGKPLGALLFDPASHKLVSWIILNMGGYLFLTPNMY